MSDALIPQSLPPAGWYPSNQPGFERWWDGVAWTDTQRPLGLPTPTPQYGGQQAISNFGSAVAVGLPATDQRTSSVEITLAWVFTVLTLGYLLPWAVAATRGKSNSVAVALVNLFAGWTVVGWIAALIMACTAHQQRMNVVQVVNSPHYH